MTADDLQRALDEPMTPARFNELVERFRAGAPTAAFECLFAVALNPKQYGHDQWASRLLIVLDPPCPLNLGQALTDIGDGELDPSNRLIPFYLAGQFGKGAVIQATNGSKRVGVSGIAYWLGVPLIELVESDVCWLNKWRWQG